MVDPLKRPTASEALKSSWLQKEITRISPTTIHQYESPKKSGMHTTSGGFTDGYENTINQKPKLIMGEKRCSDHEIIMEKAGSAKT